VEDISDTEEAIDPDTERMRGELGVEARGEAAKPMGIVSFDVQLERELAVDGLDDLAAGLLKMERRAMRVLFVNYEVSLGVYLHPMVESEGHTITTTRSAAKAIRILDENRHEAFLLFADNTLFNAEAMCVFAMVREHPAVRRRMRIIGWNALHDRDSLQERADGMLDDFLPMPFNVQQLLNCIAANAAQLPD
jgi:CheY-like chemotaxis protein